VESDPLRGLAVVRVEGEIGIEDVLSAITRVWKEPAFQQRACVLWDVRGARVDSLHWPEVRRIVGLERSERPDARHARLAFVVSTDVEFGVARMVEGAVANGGVDVRVFRDDEAGAWRWLTEAGGPARGKAD
jgi:hypothetical protein